MCARSRVERDGLDLDHVLVVAVEREALGRREDLEARTFLELAARGRVGVRRVVVQRPVDAQVVERRHGHPRDGLVQPGLDNTTTVLDRAREVLRLQGWIGEVQRTAHARDSADKRFDYYTPALAKRVCRLQARDFTNFGYPCWDGIKDTFRIL